MSNKKVVNKKSKRDLIIQAGIELIPYVGNPISTIYFGLKQEKQFQRLESFYNELNNELCNFKGKFAPISDHNEDALISILELLNEKIENEAIQEKRVFLKNFLVNSLIFPINDNFDERKYFLQTLSIMTFLECELLSFLYKQKSPIQISSIKKSKVDQYAIVGSIQRLKSYGFLSSRQGSFSIGGNEDNSLAELVLTTKFGGNFCEFCII
jgi:hypothetical protein|tara:strand:- start:180 stop:812 length:633 start_codon:yes stop_codon:yes gene_type:complete